MVNNFIPFLSYAFSNALTRDFITQQLHSYVLSYNLQVLLAWAVTYVLLNIDRITY